MKVISLGWGVQSFTLAVMSALGDLESVDVAIHADTMHEKTATYEFAKRWTPWLEERGVKVVTVKAVDAEVINPSGGVMIPAFGRGIIKRQCTYGWKIIPQRRWLQANRNGEPVETWLGISLDEVQRMKESGVKYITNRWPLIEMRMSRHDCKLYLDKHGIEIPTKSSCVFCPFQSMRGWANLPDADFKKSVEVDRIIRKALQPGDLFLLNTRQPLEEADLSQDTNQLNLFENECEGYCGV